MKRELEESALSLKSIITCTMDNGANTVNAVDLLSVIFIPSFVDSTNIDLSRCVGITQVKRFVSSHKNRLKFWRPQLENEETLCMNKNCFRVGITVYLMCAQQGGDLH